MSLTGVNAHLEAVGTEMFGSKHRLCVGMFCARHMGGIVTFPEFVDHARRLGWPRPAPWTGDMGRFERLGMCALMPRPAGMRAVVWGIRTDRLWMAFSEMARIDEAARAACAELPDQLPQPPVTRAEAITRLLEMEGRFR